MLEIGFAEKTYGSIPYLEQWLGTWLMEPAAFSSLAESVQSLDVGSHLERVKNASDLGSTGYHYTDVSDGVAVVNIRGTMMKHRSSFGMGLSTVQVRRDLRAIASDETVNSVLLLIESPGGTAAGTMELANEVSQLNSSKPVTAFIEDVGASAAYWVASQASKIYANPMAHVGSIGTYAVVQDASGMAAQRGVKVHVIRAGAFKGMGTAGTEVTPDQLAELQRLIDQVNEGFVSSVASGRSMPIEQIRTLADGRVHLAFEAYELGLIDGVKSFEEVYGMVQGRQFPRSRRMSEKQAATANEIKSACPGITADKILSYLEGEKSLEECQTDWVQELATENAVLREQLEESHSSLKAANDRIENLTKGPGVEPLDETPPKSLNQSTTAEWRSLIREKRSEGLDQAKAAAAVAKENPELRQRMIEETNASRSRRAS